MTYDAQHTRALAMVAKYGTDIVWSKTVTPQDDTTGAPGTPVTTTWSGKAILRVNGSRRQYRDPVLTDTREMEFFYAPTVAGDIPAEDASATWDGITVRSRRIPKVINLDGQGAIAAYVECVLA